MAVRKTLQMAAIELQDQVARQAERRDVRAIIGELWEEHGGQQGVAEALEIDQGTLSRWISYHLEGRVVEHAGLRRLVFAGFGQFEFLTDEVPAGTLAGLAA